MDKFLYIAMSGAKNNMASLAIRANNLANANTDGFKADMAQANALQAEGEGLPTRVFSIANNPWTDFSAGSYKTTGRELDVAINGEGWIAVEADNGTEAYTRSGSLSFDATGVLKNSRGHAVLGNSGGPIVLPIPISKIEIAQDGTISVRPQGAPANIMDVVDQIKLVSVDETQLTKKSDGLFQLPEDGAIASDPAITLSHGVVEGSNVNAVTELVALIDIQRQFEMQIKMMKTAEEQSKASASLMRIS